MIKIIKALIGMKNREQTRMICVGRRELELIFPTHNSAPETFKEE